MGPEVEARPAKRRAFDDLEAAFARAAAGRSITRVLDVGGHRVRLETEFAGDGYSSRCSGRSRTWRQPASLRSPSVVGTAETTGVELPDSVDCGEVATKSLPALQRDVPRRWALTRPDPGG